MFAVKKFIKDWMLPIAIITGITLCLTLVFVPPLARSVEPGFSRLAKGVQPFFVGVMLFLQFNKVSPHDLRFTKWHWWLLGVQTGMFVLLGILAGLVPDGEVRILIECAMLCFICPTAAAAGVITDKLGGSLSDTVSYVVLINTVAAFLIPIVIPFVNPSAEASFIESFFAICKRVFPMLVFPLLLAWFVRYTMRRLQRFLMRYTHWAFYCWSLTLSLAVYLATKAFLGSGISLWAAALICLVSLGCCLAQFAIGKALGRRIDKTLEVKDVQRKGKKLREDHNSITAGQALGQKNTGFLIWLGYSYMTPVTSVAGGLYSIWHNIVNSYELYEQRHGK